VHIVGNIKGRFLSVFLQQGDPVGVLEQLTGAQYVTLQIKIGSKKVKTCHFGSAKWFWPSVFAPFA
jgi:hypothetical protein